MNQIQPQYGDEQADAGRDCRNRLARPNSQARTRPVFFFLVQLTTSWQPYPIDPYSCYMCDHTYIHKQPVTGTTLRTTGPVPADSRQ